MTENPQERGILFTTEMSDQTELAKTETRRVISFRNPHPIPGLKHITADLDQEPLKVAECLYGPADWTFRFGSRPIRDEAIFRCPYGVPGDHLYVREQFAFPLQQDNVPPRAVPPVTRLWFPGDPDGFSRRGKWRRGMHMPKWCARRWLTITSVGVERVQDIEEGGALREGVSGLGCDHMAMELTGAGMNCTDCMNTGWLEPPGLHFRDLWNDINAGRGFGWDRNPWVWVLKFRRRH